MAIPPRVSVITERFQVSITAQVVLSGVELQAAMAMRGFARKFRATRRTENWMKDLREGEE